ncbi:XRE family transcriptional regulator [Listeria monocytogenes]|uniref:helix-turn-helix domain-containing protein n=1 Tax=Listeria monocytogenes TaxID=1639 RepID=UPI0010D0B116|nr:helix-turn-helix transcriptional regulator [Listeria monocytogenes]EAC7181334.1 XRE family transcriptional regulator [Listeria monocytogenes]EAC8000084.1 XRE family transcriptional regulator [Listeria monocytogenes]EAF1189816.1 XRE family transcriptional regulator [Listeria monocytogenes]EAK8400093.1 XRE family transcriptional regulator [Listeria monocytogenes]EIL9238529.1 helix-turn-helix transcriptional regulator [Listeria monocytogenes]
MFPERLRELRKIEGKTQQQMADLLGVSRPAYTAYELGKREPDFETLSKLAQIFDVTVDYLLAREILSISKDNPALEIIASHIAPDATEQEIEEIIAFIEAKRKEKSKTPTINLVEIAAAKDEEVAKFLEENPDFRYEVDKVVDEEEAIRSVKTFIEIYKQNKL